LDELREALRARDEFIAVAAHELRNPMTPIGIRVHALLNAAREPGVDVPPRLRRCFQNGPTRLAMRKMHAACSRARIMRPCLS
jgi:signal transduction histidine kinase